MRLTGEMITDEHIRELRRISVNDPSLSSRQVDEICCVVSYALDDGKLSFGTIREARARCAEIWNVRNGTAP